MELHVRYEGDDDPDKCSARKLARMDEAELHRATRSTPPGIVLNPFAEQALSPADRPTAGDGARHSRLVALDVPGDRRTGSVRPRRGAPLAPLPRRRQPGQLRPADQLTTVEAIAAALVIFGEKKRAEDVLSKFNWGHTFLELNEEPLRRYAACADSTDVVDVQDDYLAEE